MTAVTEDREAALARLRPWVERARGFSGWDFDLLKERRLGPPFPWSYPDEVRRVAEGATAVLDLGTGGGERLAALRDDLPRTVAATEEWHVNAPIAWERLTPLGVDVVNSSNLELPFGGESFDLVIDRHTRANPSEVERVLAPGGLYLTQQVGRWNWLEIRPHFPRATDGDDHLAEDSQSFERLGFEVAGREHQELVAYPSLGEFVYMLTVASWTIPDFDVERDLDALLALEADCLGDEGFVVTEHRYLLTARKPAT